jgi:transposase
VLLSHEGYSVEEIARITRPSDDTVRRWRHRFQDGGCPGLREGARPGRPPKITAAVQHLLRAGGQLSPRVFGIRRPAWTMANRARLAERRLGVRVTAECIRQHVHRLDFVCRRPTWTVKHLAQAQPGYAQKKGPSPGGCGTRRPGPTSTSKTRPS